MLDTGPPAPAPIPILLSGVARSAITGAPRIRRTADILPPGAWPAAGDPGNDVFPLRARLIRLPGFNVVADLPDSIARQFQDQLNDAGSGSITLINGDEALSDIKLGDLVQFLFYGQVVFTMVIEQIEEHIIDPEEESGEVTNLSGRGINTILEWGLVYPARGPYTLPIEQDRLFNWTSPQYDDRGWLPPKVLARDANPYWADSFQDIFGFPIWADRPDCDGLFAPPGTVYFRRTFEVPLGINQLHLAYVADNIVNLYLDGQPIGGVESGPPFHPATVDIDVSAGTHYLAAECVNVPLGDATSTLPAGVATHTVVGGDTLWGIAVQFYGDGRQWRLIYDTNQAEIESVAVAHGRWNPKDPGHWIFPGETFNIPGVAADATGDRFNPGGLICDVWGVDKQSVGLPSTPILTTDTQWVQVGYLPYPPGMTVGEIIIMLLREWFDRGQDFVPVITPRFTKYVDSNGTPWPLTSDISTKTGTDIFTFLKELSDTYIDFFLSPGTLELFVFAKDTRGRDSGVVLVAADVDDPNTGNLTSLSKKTQ